MLNKKEGKLFIISAPSGAGKTTLCQAALPKLKNIVRSLSCTTRKSRGNEKDGVDYHFISEEKFKKMIHEGQFSEWAVVYGEYYGTPKKFLEENIKRGIDIIFNIDVQGGEALRKKYKNTVSIFIQTPSFQDLKERLEKRKSDSHVTIQERLKTAKAELKAASSYPYHIINDNFEKALQELIEIIKIQRQKP